MSQDYPKREERHRVQGLPDVKLVLARSGSQTTTVVAQLLDVSPGGAKLCLASPLVLGELIGVNLENPDGKVELAAAARVCWVRPAEGNRWTAGCAFAPRLPDEGVNHLFSRRLLERRKFKRHLAAGSASIQWELETTQSNVRLCNASVGGFCIETDDRGRAAERLLLFLTLPDGRKLTISARSQWQMKSADRYLIGCCFLDNSGYPKMLEFLERTGVRPRPRRRVAPLPLVGIGVVLILYWLLMN